MRRIVRLVQWGAVGFVLVTIAVYIYLTVSTGISPPVVPITSSTELRGFATGDGVIVEPLDHLLSPGDLAVVRVRGAVRLVAITSVDVLESAPRYGVRGFRDGGTEQIVSSDVVGRNGRRLPLAGWPLIAIRQRVGQVVLAVMAAGALLALLFRRAGKQEAGTPTTSTRHQLSVALPLPLLALGAGDPMRAADAPAQGAGDPDPGAADVEPPTSPTPSALALVVDPDVAGDEGDSPTSAAVAFGVIPGALAVPYVGGVMSISPDDLRQVQFAQSRRGYDTDAVDRALDAVADRLESLLTERVELIEQIKRLEREAERLRGSELGLGQALNSAKAEVEAIKAEATRLISAAQGGAPAAAANGGGGAGDAAIMQLLGETRAMRSLMQSFLTQVSQPAPAEQPAPQAPQPPPGQTPGG